MAIRNASMGGTDWVTNENLTSTDLNDTFDKAFDYIKTLTSFWLNSDLYSTYENFESYSTGTWASQTTLGATSTTIGNFTVDVSAVGSGSASSYQAAVTIENNMYSGSSGKDVVLYAKGSTASYSLTAKASITANGLLNNKHVYIPFKFNPIRGGGNYNRVTYNIYAGSTLVSSITTACGGSLDPVLYSNLLVVAKGSNTYDFYDAGLLASSNVVNTTGTLKIEAYTEYEDSDIKVIIPYILTSSGSV